MRPALPGSGFASPSLADDAAEAADAEAPGSATEAFGRKVAASGDEAYKSCKSVRPNDITGLVA